MANYELKNTSIGSSAFFRGTDEADKITIESVTGGGGFSQFSGADNNDVFSVKNVSMSGNAQSSNISLCGDAGNDSLDVSNVTVDAGDYFGNIYIFGDTAYGENSKSDKDTIKVSNISVKNSHFQVEGNADNDYISVNSVTADVKGYVNIYGGTGNDTIVAKNLKAEPQPDEYLVGYKPNGGTFDFNGGDGADSISISNATIKFSFELKGGAGNDTISFDNIISDHSSFKIYGDEESTQSRVVQTDTILLNNVTINGGSFYLNNGVVAEDIFNISLNGFQNNGQSWIYGSQYADTLTLKQIKNDDQLYIYSQEGNDKIFVNNITNNANINIGDGKGNDSISVDGVTQNNGNFYIQLGDNIFENDTSDIDTISVKNVTQSGGNFHISNGGESKNSISVQNVKNSGGSFAAVSGDNFDTLSVSNVTQTGGSFYIDGSDGDDKISVSSVKVENSSLGINGNIEKIILTPDDDDVVGGGTASISDADTIFVESLNAGNNGQVYIYSGEDDDDISAGKVTVQSGGYVEIRGAAGNDTISVSDMKIAKGGKVSILGEEDDDYISVKNASVQSGGILSVEGGEGDDTISVENSNGVTVSGGAGNDIFYFDGSANAVVKDFTNDDAIALSGYYDTATFEDGVLSYGTGVKVTLNGISSLSEIENAVIYNGNNKMTFGEFVVTSEWKISNGVVSYGNSFEISGLSANATFNDIKVGNKVISDMTPEEILSSGKPVTISNSALDKYNTVSITNGYTLALSADVTEVVKETPAHWEIPYSGNAVYFSNGLSAGFTTDGKYISYYPEPVEGEILAQINGLSYNATVDDIIFDEDTMIVTIKQNALDQINIVEVDDNSYRLALDTDVEQSTITDPAWQVDNGTAKLVGETTAGYVVEHNQIKYKEEGEGETLITISGLSTNATANDISLNERTKTVTISANALDATKTVEISDANYKLALGADVTDIPKNLPEYWEVSQGTAYYYTNALSAGFVALATRIEYQEQTLGGVVFQISGLSTNATENDVSVDKKSKTVTIYANALDATKNVKITGDADYKLALGADVTVPIDTPEYLEVDGGKANYYSTGLSAGFVSEGTQIKYQAETKGGVVFQMSGLSANATENDISVDKTAKTVTISANALDTKKTVKITGDADYKLALSADVTIPTDTPEYLEVDGGKANYYSAGLSAGFVAEDKQIKYQAETKGGVVVQMSGLNTNATENDISVDKTAKTVTISANALDATQTVKITGDADYKLALGADVTKSVPSDGGWKISSGTAIYTASGNSAGYTLSDNQIIYVDETVGGESSTEIKVTGLKTSAKEKDISLDAATKTVSLAVAAVQGKVTITDGYALNMGKGTYSKTTVTGGNGDDTISNSGNKLAINGGAGNDIISLSSGTSGNTINGSAGDDYISSAKGKNIYQYAEGDDNDVIEGFSENDTLQITSGKISNWKVEDTDLIFYVGEGSITIKDGADKKINTAVGKGKAVTNYYTADGILNDKQTAITLRADTTYYSIADKKTITSIDASATENVAIYTDNGKKAVKVIGGVGMNIIYGGAGNDTLYGGDNTNIVGNIKGDAIYGNEGNDKLFGNGGDDSLFGGTGNDTLTGGTGADLFVYSYGNDIITDYAEEDKISIAGGEISSISVSGKDVAIKVKKNTLKIKGGLNKAITINDETKIYEKGAIYDADKTNVTLTAATKLSDSIVNVDGAAMSAALKFSASDRDNEISGGKGGDSILGNAGNDTINGNAGNDKLFGGDGNDVLDGGAGNDSIFGGTGNNILTGGVGNDVFIYEGGNDLISDYTAGKDKISISAEITNAKVEDTDVIFETASGKITVEGGAGNKITILTKIDGKSKTLNQIYTADGIYNDKQTAITLSADTKNYIAPAKPAVTSIDGSATNGVQITGGTKADKIFGGNGKDTLNGGNGNDSISGNGDDDKILGGAGNDKLFGDAGNDILNGGAGNDTLWGGAGNDTLTGGDGNDVFVFEGGNDLITDYTAKEKIKFTEEIKNTITSGGNVIFETASGKVTVQNGASQKITITNFKNKTETYSATSAKTFDLICDNNFVTDEFGIDDITETKFEVQNIETQNNLELSQPVITYSESDD